MVFNPRMTSHSTSLAERLAAVHDRIATACTDAGRSADEVTLVAVSKKHSPEAVAEAAAAGQTVFGENRVQEASQKIPLCDERLDFHLIGHLQSNKAKFVPRLFSTVHSVDSGKLMRALDAAAGQAGTSLRVFLQVNVAGEAQKFGLKPNELPSLLRRAEDCYNLNVDGLMTMPPIVRDPEDARRWFSTLRELRDRMRDETGFPLDQLSMGMSHDMEAAIKEGATFVRVGTDIFGKRVVPQEHPND